jgi:glutathione synthase/RimK-type ligase-like ATP-grasp enzyme
LVVGGKIIGSYLRKPSDGLHANLAQMANAEKATLERPAAKLVATIQQDLIVNRIGFAAIDTVGKWLMEVNVANPGGLGTLNRLYDQDVGPEVVKAIEHF